VITFPTFYCIAQFPLDLLYGAIYISFVAAQQSRKAAGSAGQIAEANIARHSPTERVRGLLACRRR
jgi:hypothetical protein